MESKAKPHSSKASLRQSVTIPAKLAIEVRRVATERHTTTGDALIQLAELGLETEAKAKLSQTYRQFMTEQHPDLKAAAGKDMISAISGTDALAEDPLR